MIDRRKPERGFTLALSLVVTVVVMMLAAGLITRIIVDMRGAKSTQQVAAVANDADVGLSHAEAEIFKNLDELAAAIWTIATNDVIAKIEKNQDKACPESKDVVAWAACAPADEPGKADPLRNLDLIGNARNWSAFANWPYYIGNKDKFNLGYTSDSTDEAGWSPKAPVPPYMIWDGSDRTLTNDWWYVPRDDNADVDYYGWSSGTSADWDKVFPMAMAGEKPSGGSTQTGYFRAPDGKLVAASVANTVTHNFWYKQVLPIRAEASPDYAVPAETVWPNRDSEYGDHDNGTGAGSTRYVWNTPFYKKIFGLPDGRKVAAYLRLDLRDYFRPRPGLASDKSWEQPGWDELKNQSFKSKYNFLKFFLASVPQGRIEKVPGTETYQYRPVEMRTKYILVQTLGAWNRSMAVVDLLGYTFKQKDDRQFPAVLSTAGGYLKEGTDINGYVFRADGNRGYNWNTMPGMLARSEKLIYPPGWFKFDDANGWVRTYTPGLHTWTAPASERFVYLFEQVGTKDLLDSGKAATATFFIYASYVASYPTDSTDVTQIEDAAKETSKILAEGKFPHRRIDVAQLVGTDSTKNWPGTSIPAFPEDSLWSNPCYSTGDYQALGRQDGHESACSSSTPGPGGSDRVTRGNVEDKYVRGEDATTSYQSSLSAFVTASGSFFIGGSKHPKYSPGSACDDPKNKTVVCPTPDPLPCPDWQYYDCRYKVKKLWTGPVSGRVYFTTNEPPDGFPGLATLVWRRSFRYDATASTESMR